MSATGTRQLYVIAGDCPASLIVRRVTGLEPGCCR
jgi:hypothetical protein